MNLQLSGIRGALVRMSCDTLEPSLSFFVQSLGFRIEAIYPADSPSTAILSGHGLSFELVSGTDDGVKSISLLCDNPNDVAQGAREVIAPNGVRIQLAWADPPMQLPETQQALVINHANAEATWSVGRAGLRYRDLLPQRHGGAFIASHIRTLEGGLVPDYVHFHKIRFQMIFCRKGWVRVVYEGQGEPFLMHAGDCVLQPPMIRHRVLESSAGAEVVEIGSPAKHITIADHQMPLPNAPLPPEHDFGGQRFVFHQADKATWQPWRLPGFRVRDTGIGAATAGLAGARVVRFVKPGELSAQRSAQQHATEFCFYFVLAGQLTLSLGDASHVLQADDSVTLPGGQRYAFTACSDDLELLEVTLPDTFDTRLEALA